MGCQHREISIEWGCKGYIFIDGAVGAQYLALLTYWHPRRGRSDGGGGLVRRIFAVWFCYGGFGSICAQGFASLSKGRRWPRRDRCDGHGVRKAALSMCDATGEDGRVRLRKRARKELCECDATMRSFIASTDITMLVSDPGCSGGAASSVRRDIKGPSRKGWLKGNTGMGARPRRGADGAPSVKAKGAVEE